MLLHQLLHNLHKLWLVACPIVVALAPTTMLGVATLALIGIHAGPGTWLEWGGAGAVDWASHAALLVVSHFVV